MNAPAARTRREAKKDGVRRQIAQAAVRLFEAKGFAATTMDEIGAEADVSRPTVFNYFARKEDIPAFFMGWMLEDRVASRLDTWSALSPLAAIRACLGRVGHFEADFGMAVRGLGVLAGS